MHAKTIEELILSSKKRDENSVWIFEDDFFFALLLMELKQNMVGKDLIDLK